MKFEWQVISRDETDYILTCAERSKVIGGWLVINRTGIPVRDEQVISESMVFIPDPKHEWSIE